MIMTESGFFNLTVDLRLSITPIYSILKGRSWIGYHDPDGNDKYVWLNENNLSDDDDNWQTC